MGISVTQLLIILAIVIVLFGTKRLRNLGGDLGGAIKGFRNAVKEGSEEKQLSEQDDGDSVETEVNSAAQDKAEK